MVNVIQETTQRDTTGYSENYGSIHDLLTIPGAEVQRLEPNVAGQAFVHLDGSAWDWDHDTFMISLRPGRDYRVQITPENPAALAYNKIGVVYDPEASFPSDRGYILNTTDGYVNGSIYSSSFSVSRNDEYVLSLSFTESGVDGVPYSGPEAYRVTVIDLTAGMPEDEVVAPILPRAEVEKMALLYQAALDREPDVAGLNYFVGNLRDGQSLQEVANSFYAADEFRSQFTTFDDASYINRLYENVLNRPADQAGFEYWLDELGVKGLSHADVLVSFAESAENRANAEAWVAGLDFDTTSGEWIL